MDRTPNVAYEQMASDLAATFYAASMLPDPTIESRTRPKALAVFRDKGEELASSLLRPQRRAVIRCTCGTRSTHPGRRSRAIATVHDRGLVVVKGPRGPKYQGLRLVDHSLIDFGIARRDGFKSTSVWCYGCGALHQLGFRWLQRARRNEISTPSKQYQLDPWGNPIAPQGYTPRHPNDATRLAFATTTGPLDGPEVIVTLGWLYAFDYRDHFGFKPPHDQHLLKLTKYGDSRVQDPHIELLPPQWWKLRHDPELLAEERIEGPLPAGELQDFAEYIATLNSQDRDDELMIFEQTMDTPDFRQLRDLLTEEAR
ncbi:MAG: hypothetical protein V3U46_02235 [Acidimicrobiia bacterium]